MLKVTSEQIDKLISAKEASLEVLNDKKFKVQHELNSVDQKIRFTEIEISQYRLLSIGVPFANMPSGLQFESPKIKETKGKTVHPASRLRRTNTATALPPHVSKAQKSARNRITRKRVGNITSSVRSKSVERDVSKTKARRKLFAEMLL
jgi:hypothetical protein